VPDDGGEAEDEPINGVDLLLDLECSLVDATGWALRDIDETDIESLIPFIFRYPIWKREQGSPQARERKLYADDVNWL
jgi:hypothetical protein